jgi:outer membrane lipoprotein-sorting protein
MRIALALCLLLCTAAKADSFQPIPADAQADQVLDALKMRGDTLKDFSGDVTLTTTDQTTADSTAQVGNVLFQQLGDGDGRIRVHFTQHVEGDKYTKEDHEFTLADGWLVDRDYLKKNEVRRQVVRPGQKINLLKLGEGPFPLPIGQSREEVRRQFDVSLIAPAKDDPAGTVHLLLKPNPLTDLARKYSQIDVYVDRQNGMPTQIVTLDNDAQRMQSTVISNLHMNSGLKDADFSLPQVDGWDQTVEPFRP